MLSFEKVLFMSEDYNPTTSTHLNAYPEWDNTGNTIYSQLTRFKKINKINRVLPH